MSIGDPKRSIVAERIPIAWNEEMSIYTSEAYLKAVADDYGWIGGFDNNKELCFILPYSIIHKFPLTIARFRVETIPTCEGLSVQEEMEFLNSSMKYLRALGVDLVAPATTNTIFRTYPDGAIAAPYSSFVVDLSKPTDVLWKNISHKYRKDIRAAEKNGVVVVSGLEYIEEAYKIINMTFKRSDLPFMRLGAFRKMLIGLGDNMKLMMAVHNGTAQSCTAYHYSKYAAYAVHGGSIDRPFPGAMKLLQWEAMKYFAECGVNKFDFVGARVNPPKGSKQEGLLLFKQYMGGKQIEGYIWKYHFKPMKSMLYSIAMRLLRGGDIVDAERHKVDMR